jgi:recA bacterial DNA recombination protein
MAKKEFNVNDYIEAEKQAVPDTQYKETEYVVMPQPVQKAISMPGFPLGHISMLYGLSDSGKTGLLLNAVKQAQQQGILPVLIITETKLTKARIVQAGIDLNKIIIVDNLKFLEPVYDYISCKTQEVLDGKLPINVMIFWDSAAGCPSKDSFEIKKDGKIEKNFDNRKNANVIGFYNNIIASRIAETRKVGCPGTVGLVLVTQAYVGEKPKFPPGIPAPILPNGGEKIWFPLSLGLEIKEGTRLTAEHKGKKVGYGIISYINTKKNHINELNTGGEVVLAGSQLFENDKKLIEQFKEDNKDRWSVILDAALEEIKEDET